MSDTPVVKPKRSRRRKLRYALWSLGALVVLVLAAGGVEYARLQPLNHFRHVPVRSAPSSTGSAVSTGGGATGTSTSGPGGSSGTTPITSVTAPAQKPDTFNVLLLGSDERTGGAPGHSDSIIIVHVDLNKQQYNMLSIPRDTRIYLSGFGCTKITSVMYLEQANRGMQAGTQDAIDAISNLTGLPINYYAETNYWGLQDIVNSIGGITMHIPFPVTLTHPWYGADGGKYFAPGNYTLGGQLVTDIVHERYSLANGDYGRQQLQEEALIGIAKKVLEHPTFAPAVIRGIPKYLISTDMSTQDMLSLVLAVRHFQTSQVHYYQATGIGKLMYNDPLQANDDEILLNMAALHQIVQQHFE